MQDDIIDLQTRVAYQEDTITSLNNIVTQQQRDIQQLQQQIRLLAQRVQEVQMDKSQLDSLDTPDERPPHY